jgi:predicted RNA-binding protein YlxR (DUF448 family)
VTAARTTAAPTRTCVGCARRDAQSAMIRLRSGVGGSVVAGGRVGSGRSAYVHAYADCIAGLMRSKGLGKSLRTTIAKEARQELMRALEAGLASGGLTKRQIGQGAGIEA